MTTRTFDPSIPPSSQLKRDRATLELLTDFVAETDVGLARMDELLMSATRRQLSEPELNELFRLFHAFKTVARHVDAADVSRLSTATETLLEGARSGRLRLEGDVLERLFDASTVMRDLVAEVWTATLEERTFIADATVDTTIASLAEIAEPVSNSSVVASHALNQNASH